MRVKAVVIAALVLTASAACGDGSQASDSAVGSDREPVTINYHAVAGPQELRLAVNACKAGSSVSVASETTTEITLKATADPRPAEGNDCSDQVTVQLQAPLDDRAVTDETTGGPIMRVA